MLKGQLRIQLIMAVTTADICRSLIPRVALLNRAIKSFNSSSLSWVNCIRSIDVFLARLLLEKYAVHCLEKLSNMRMDFGGRGFHTVHYLSPKCWREGLHIIAYGVAHNLIKSTKALK
ncbi:hypothetical protein Adt_14359 [Abeliophyllum distichum]|uniref:Uncharacterized protein n=1 Tax=Abeliophyllum distichum TaxID=126358 RepID=A0ABD1TZE9_9LAMI